MCHFAAQSYAIHQVKRSVDQRLAEMNIHKSASCTATRTSKEKIHIPFIMIRLYHRDWIVENGFIGSHGIERSNETESVWKGWSWPSVGSASIETDQVFSLMAGGRNNSIEFLMNHRRAFKRYPLVHCADRLSLDRFHRTNFHRTHQHRDVSRRTKPSLRTD